MLPYQRCLLARTPPVRPSYYAFRLLGQLDGPRFAVAGEQDGIRAIAGDGNGYKHLILWRYGESGADEVEVRADIAGADARNSRVVRLDPVAQVNNIQVIHFGRSDDLKNVSLKLKPWDIHWIEIE